MAEAQGIRMKNPAHPGGFVKSEVIEPLELSVTGAAKALGVTRAALSAVLNERARLSPEMALRIEKAFGVSMDTLMRMQTSYDIARTRMRAEEIEVALSSKAERAVLRSETEFRAPFRGLLRRGGGKRSMRCQRSSSRSAKTS